MIIYINVRVKVNIHYIIYLIIMIMMIYLIYIIIYKNT